MIEHVQNFLSSVSSFFIIYMMIYSTFLFLTVTVGSSVLYTKRRYELMKNYNVDDYYVPMSIVVPAHNEEITVVSTVISLLDLDYNLYEIIVVDDGSSDKTSEKMIEYFNMERISKPIHRKIECQPEEFIYAAYDRKVPVYLVRKRNGGKADALNMGINVATYPYFICMDADSVLQSDSLKRIVRPVIENSDVIAVGGVVRPSNGVEINQGKLVRPYKLPKNILAAMQVLEYDRSFLASRILFDLFNGTLIISGAFGLFHKESVISVGGYDSKTMGEDMELIVRLHVYCLMHKSRYSIKYAVDAVCWSQAPEKLGDLKKQRRRWHLGLFQSMWKHRSLFLNPKFGFVSVVSFIYYLIYELINPYIELFGVITIIIAMIFNLINIPFMIAFLIIYALYGAVLTISAFYSRIHTMELELSLADSIKALFLCLFENTFLRFYLSWARSTAFFRYRKKKLSWGKIERKQIQIK